MFKLFEDLFRSERAQKMASAEQPKTTPAESTGREVAPASLGTSRRPANVSDEVFAIAQDFIDNPYRWRLTTDRYSSMRGNGAMLVKGDAIRIHVRRHAHPHGYASTDDEGYSASFHEPRPGPDKLTEHDARTLWQMVEAIRDRDTARERDAFQRRFRAALLKRDEDDSAANMADVPESALLLPLGA